MDGILAAHEQDEHVEKLEDVLSGFRSYPAHPGHYAYHLKIYRSALEDLSRFCNDLPPVDAEELIEILEEQAEALRIMLISYIGVDPSLLKT